MAVVSKPGAYEQARQLVLRYGWNAMSYQILNPGMRRWFSDDGQAVVGYVRAGGYRVVAGAPVCAPDRVDATVAAFATTARRAGERLCYFGAEMRLINILRRQGPVATLLLGAQPVWDPRGWPAIIAGKASLRAQLARARNKQVTVQEWPRLQANNNPALERVLQEWLQTRGLPPMHFLVEPRLLDSLHDRRIFVALQETEVVGFLVATPVPLRHGWLIELTARGARAPNGTTELLLDTAMRALAQDGALYVTLGLSPLAQTTPPPLPDPPLSVRLLLGWVRAHGRRFYNFEGLTRFKSKFQPDSWEPIYAVTNTSRVSPGTLYAIAGAFSGTSPVWFIGHTLLRAVRREAQWSARVLQQKLRD